jgi:HK97 family phage major capsid protein
VGHEPLSTRIKQLNNRGARPIFRSEVNDLAATAEDLERRADTALMQVYEPPVYGPGSGHGWFADVMRASYNYGTGDGGPKAAADRLRRHQAWQHHQNERRLQAIAAEADMTTREALSATPAEASLLHRWEAAGGQTFEMRHRMEDIELRAASRQDGTGGYLIPPAWLSDQFIHAPRAGAPFAALWQRATLPRFCDTVNVPQLVLGTGSGFQAGDLAPGASRDPQDSFVSCQVRTLAANIDIAQQWLDQAPVTEDEVFGADLAEDFMTSLDAVLIYGNTALAQPAGIIPGGAFSAASMVWLSSTTNASGMTWANGGGGSASITGSMHQATAQLYAKIARYRALPPTAWVVPSSVWAIIAGAGVDSQDRPLILPGVHPSSAVKMLHGVPLTEDMNIVETFGGTLTPQLSVASSGRYAATDGNGTWVPVLLGRWSDCVYWQSEPVIAIMPEVLSGSLKVRFQVRCYIATAPGRIVWGGQNVSFSGTDQAGGVNNLAPVSYGAVTSFTSNSVMQPAAAGF